MTIKDQINADLKAALLQGDKVLATTLRGLKSAILYVEVAQNKRDQGLSDGEVVDVLRKEAKKRKESVELFARGGNQEKADAEQAELAVTEKYLPRQLSDSQLAALVDRAISEVEQPSLQMMGKIIGRVKELSEGNADGGRISTIVKERLGNL